jgi:hypothetical protein
MKKEIKIEVPNNWGGVTLRKYLALKKDMEAYAGEEEAIIACLFHHLCDFPLEYIQQLDINTYIAIKDDLVSFFNKIDLPLNKFVHIDGVEYGFEPNLSQMAYGAYVDISKYETMDIDNNWAEIMSILYRPVEKHVGKLYDIKTYDGKIDGEKFLDVTMDVHFGAIFFFKTLLTDLQKDTLKYLTGLTGLPHNIKSTLEKNGNLTQVLSNLHKTI